MSDAATIILSPPVEGAPSAAPDAAAAPPPPPWYASLLEGEGLAEARGYVENKGWKGLPDLLQSYQHAEKLRGVPVDRLLTLPEKLDDREAMAPVLAKLGLAPPEKPEAYGFTDLPELQGEDVDTDRLKAMQDLAHKVGLPPGMATEMVKGVTAWEREILAQTAQREREAAAVEMGQLRAEWGAEYDGKAEAARRAARTFSVPEQVISNLEAQMGAAGVVKLFADIGQRLGEAPFIQGSSAPASGGLSKEGALARIQQLQGDREWLRAWKDGDAEKKATLDRLFQVAYGP